MKKLFYLAGMIALLISCDQVVFPESQPRRVKAMDRIPSELQGIYLDQDGDTLTVTDRSFIYAEKKWRSADEEFLSDSLVLKSYKNKYFFNYSVPVGHESYWITYMLDPVDDGKYIDVYAMNPDELVNMAKLQEITPKVRDIENGEFDMHLFAPRKKHYKKIIRDSIFSKVIFLTKISSGK
ncbi:MAG TPA: hypothetical protein VK994_06480 [Bacteroidales bacterium]|nr:hypothetical protein [Bacteroidales bacterium]